MQKYWNRNSWVGGSGIVLVKTYSFTDRAFHYKATSRTHNINGLHPFPRYFCVLLFTSEMTHGILMKLYMLEIGMWTTGK